MQANAVGALASARHESATHTVCDDDGGIATGLIVRRTRAAASATAALLTGGITHTIAHAGGAEVTERKANSRDLLTLIDPLCEKVSTVRQLLHVAIFVLERFN